MIPSQKTSVTESLANGLKTRFFQEMRDGSDKAVSIFLEKGRSSKKINRNSFAKIANNVKSSFGHYALVIYEGGSTGKPYLACDLLTVIKDREFNSWKEKCLTGNTLLFVHEQNFIDVFPSIYNIGEHAISRLFLRNTTEFENNTIDYKYIIKEMIYIPLWANFWSNMLARSEDLSFYGNCFPVIPAPHGLFMCELKEPNFIEIRTFIGDQQLTHEQTVTKNLLIAAGKSLNESPICFSPALFETKIDMPFLLTPIIAMRLYDNTNYSILKNVFFHRIEDDRERGVIKSKFDSILKEHKMLANKEIENLLIKIGVKAFQTVIKQHITVIPHNSRHR